MDVQVRAFGGPRDEAGTTSYGVPAELADANAALQTLGTDLEIVTDVAGADVVHSHTWYANFAGHLASLLHGIPHIVTAHSLEPLRPWKAEQLGGGYAVSSWIEKTAYEGAAAIVAVSDGMRTDILRSYPALDPGEGARHLQRHRRRGVASRRGPRAAGGARASTRHARPSSSSAASRGRRACRTSCAPPSSCPPDVQLVLCAGAPDTPQIMAEVEGLVRGLQETREGVVWIDRLLSRHELCTVLTAATTFVCPSVYEPLGIVNLEAMACGAAVVGTATGGIPEVVVDGVTGRLVPIEQVQDGTGTPIDPDRFVADLARVLTEVVSDPRARARVRRGGPRARDGRLQLGRASPSRRPRSTRRSPPTADRLAACRRCSSSPTSSSAETPGTSSTTWTGRSATTSAG